MKKILDILLFCCISSFVFGQNPQDVEIVRGKQLLQNSGEDTLKVQSLHELAYKYIYNNPDTALIVGNMMLELSTKLNYRTGVADAHAVLSKAHVVLGNYSKAMYNALEAMKIYQSMNSRYDLATIYSAIGDIYWYMGDSKQALTYYFKHQEISMSAPDSFYFRNNLHFRKGWVKYSDVTIASAYLDLGILDSALIYAKKAFAADTTYWSFPSLVLANVYLQLNELDSALKYYRAEVRIPAQSDQIDAYIGIAILFQKQNRLDSSIFYAKKALENAQLIKYTKAIMLASDLLSDIYEKGNPVDALYYSKISARAKDSLYNREKINQLNNLVFNEELRRQELEKAQEIYQYRMKMFGLLGIVIVILLIAIILFRTNQYRQKAFTILQQQKKETDFQREKVEEAMKDLKATQFQLIQSEKMASLGELTAGIAHEIQNPLNFVNNFSEVNIELLAEMYEEIEKGNVDEIKALAKDVIENEEKIVHHGKRADGIVKGMLQHSRSSTGIKEPTDINKLAEEYFRLAYHGLRAKDKSFNATMKTDFDPSLGTIHIIPQDIGRVMLNLINNAFYAVTEKKKQQTDGYEPTVSVSTKKVDDKVVISVKDNGNGIPRNILDKIFQPFFTTKPTGEGTGLGLSMSYDIVKAHGGEINVETEQGEGSRFIIQLSLK